MKIPAIVQAAMQKENTLTVETFISSITILLV